MGAGRYLIVVLSFLPACSEEPDAGTAPGVVVDAAVAAAPATTVPPDAAAREAPPPVVVIDAPVGNVASAQPWTLAEVGEVGAGRASLAFTTMVFSLSAGGADIGGTADGFAFVSHRLTGDCDIQARVRSLQMTDPSAKAGVMIRANDPDPNAANVFLGVLAESMMGGLFQHRALKAGETTAGAPDANVRPGMWLRLTRSGRTVTAYRSVTNRVTWIKVASVDIDLGSQVSVGIAVASRNPGLATTAEVDGLRVNNLEAEPATRGWVVEELGTVASVVTVNAGTLSLAGFAEPFLMRRESGTIVYRPGSGSQTITARIDGFAGAEPNGRIGLTVREGNPPGNLPQNGAQAFIGLSSAGLEFRSRAMAGVEAVPGKTRTDVDVTRPIWLRLQKVEDLGAGTSTLTGFWSVDGTTFTALDAVKLMVPEPFMIGVLLNAASFNKLASATVSQLTIEPPR